jgi:hypothetical protein
MKQQYIDYKPRGEAAKLIATAEDIIATYRRQGYLLTLRQLYYQFVSRAAIPNTEKSYKNLGNIINQARLGGLLDWDGIEDRTRNLAGINTWDSPAQIIGAVATQFRIDKWEGQPYRPFVWVEKEALGGVVARPCRRNFVSYMSCRGYMSQSEMRAQALLYLAHKEEGQEIVILHLGDHDPSGIDMTRDILDRMDTFCGLGEVEVKRLALNIDQVQQYNPPPNPAKVTDSRFDGYQAEYGDESWELDALEPSVIDALIEDNILALRDDDLWQEKVREEAEHRSLLTDASEHWNTVTTFLKNRVI